MPTISSPHPCAIIVQTRLILLAGMTTKAAVPLLEQALALALEAGMDKSEPPCTFVIAAMGHAKKGKAAAAVTSLQGALTVAHQMGLYQPDRVEALEMACWEMHASPKRK